jgi:hypothetical protein
MAGMKSAVNLIATEATLIIIAHVDANPNDVVLYTMHLVWSLCLAAPGLPA